MATPEEMLAKAKALYDAGDVASATRLAKIAKSRMAPTESPAMTEGRAKLSGMTRNPEVQPAPPQNRDVMDVIKDNVIGVDDGVQSYGESIGTWLNRAGESMTFGAVGDEASAAAYSALPGRNYDAELARFRGNEDRMSTAGRLSADVAGAVIPAFLGVGAMASAPSVGSAMMRGAGAGLVGGATLGFTEGEGGVQNRLREAAITGALGATIGGAIPAATGAVRGIAEGVANRGVKKAFVEGAETVDDLKAAAGKLYDEARAAGVVATPDQTTKFADDAVAVLREQGLVSPSGRISSAYPKVADALNMVMDYADSQMTPTEMLQVRTLLQGAAGSADAAEARIGTKMLKAFDDFVEPMAPQIKEANAIYHRAKKGEMIETAIELAGSRAGQFSGSGFENALRTEFRGIERQIIKGQLKGISAAERKAISRVARGGAVENALRDLGKMAPRGVVSTGITAGVPFAIGNALGGPGLGAAMSGGALALGEAGRRAATAMQTRNAGMASAAMRAGGGPQFARVPAQVRGVSDALLVGQAPQAVNALREQTR